MGFGPVDSARGRDGDSLRHQASACCRATSGRSVSTRARWRRLERPTPVPSDWLKRSIHSRSPSRDGPAATAITGTSARSWWPISALGTLGGRDRLGRPAPVRLSRARPRRGAVLWQLRQAGYVTEAYQRCNHHRDYLAGLRQKTWAQRDSQQLLMVSPACSRPVPWLQARPLTRLAAPMIIATGTASQSTARRRYSGRRFCVLRCRGPSALRVNR